MTKKILMFLSAAVFALGVAGCEKANTDKAKDAMGGGSGAPAAPAPAAPAGGSQ